MERGRLLSTYTTGYWASCAACARALVFLICQAIVINILTFQNTERILPVNISPRHEVYSNITCLLCIDRSSDLHGTLLNQPQTMSTEKTGRLSRDPQAMLFPVRWRARVQTAALSGRLLWPRDFRGSDLRRGTQGHGAVCSKFILVVCSHVSPILVPLGILPTEGRHASMPSARGQLELDMRTWWMHRPKCTSQGILRSEAPSPTGGA